MAPQPKQHRNINRNNEQQLICANPNGTVATGNYNVESYNLSLTSA
jgi:hypothetical protein